jgi:hypothetical protein
MEPTQVKYLSGRLLALPANIRLGWKGLPGTNALFYYKNFVNYVDKKVL